MKWVAGSRSARRALGLGLGVACIVSGAALGCGATEQTSEQAEVGHSPTTSGHGREREPHRFVDVTSEAGIAYEHAPEYVMCGSCIPPQVMTGGAAAADYDGDGYTDLFVTRLDERDILYRNAGDGSFEDVTDSVGLTANTRSNGAVFADVDNDGDLDLFVSIVEMTPEELGKGRFHLYINDAGRFVDEALARGVARETAPVHRAWSAAFGDYDRDGYLDLHLTEWLPESAIPDGATADYNTRLFRNLGQDKPGYFEDTTEAAGVDQALVHAAGVYTFASAFTDLDADGWPDLAVAGDFGTSRLFWNNGDGSFLDGTDAAGVGSDENGMGIALGDYDLDGDLDWFLSSISCPGECPAALPETGVGVSGNRLYENQGDRRFVDATDSAGVRHGHWGWGAQFLDYDNDRDLDLVMTNGYTYPAEFYEQFYDDPMLFWENDGAGRLREVGTAVGVTNTQSGKGLLVFDYDNDGNQDVFVVNNSGQSQLLRNEGDLKHDFLQVRLRGTQSNRDGIGARVMVEGFSNSDVKLLRELRAGGQFLGQNGHVLHFGLGVTHKNIDRVTVFWPSGVEQVIRDVEPNQILQIVENE